MLAMLKVTDNSAMFIPPELYSSFILKLPHDHRNLRRQFVTFCDKDVNKDWLSLVGFS